ncbi:hypothetical protein BKP37_01965 [Anaerobacillus alkalilacustris]|uniref:Nitrogenase-stabilizing/protective protein NifW n=1 Tax=Anaerobacillus alkalilacustris TaxID=393763 RepID=A0A1S2LYD6_9BACI|nr:nitrogenase-stabilizing/protective protein NifW [Anaerobacillus alkalilacustris]OIJ17294.1 hypothetical protein BKP37_01965 [Anaerobacillus alkalilacustris]
MNIEQLHDAEDFFRFYKVPFDPKVVRVTRLHILKRFRQYLEQESLVEIVCESDAETWNEQRELFKKAYEDFVTSSPLVEKVFPVFQQQSAFFSLDMLKKGDS